MTVSALGVLPLAGGVTGFGTKAQVTPAGWPTQERLTALLKPLARSRCRCSSPLPPCWIVRLDGLQETVKSGGGGPGAGVTVAQLLTGP